MNTKIHPDIMQAPISGLNLPDGATLASAIGNRATLLVFLRHFG